MIHQVTTRIKAATPEEMSLIVKTAYDKTKNEYIAARKSDKTASYDNAERKEAYRICEKHVKDLVKYHNFKVNNDVIGIYIRAADAENNLLRPNT